MAKINVLQSSVYNKIAAGEVVERPASIVKELVENSIDAGATKIEINVENGGLTSITVSDNGCGIEKDCVETAFLNHATSKISNEKDLEKIFTLGFRGEALASIAAVSKVELFTKSKDEEFGTKLIIEGGQKISRDDIGHPEGTSIKISNLFFNTPARKKFLKKPSGEAGEITNLVQRLILSNPNVAIKYTSNGNIIFNSQGLGLESAIFSAYDKKTLENCHKINWFYRDIEVEGYVGNKNFTKPNRTYQTTIINGRYVVNSTVSMAVQRAFERYLTTRAYPFFVLNVKLPFDKIDVNVHPNKMEVKFEDAQSVFYAVYIPIKELLDEPDKSSIPEIKIESKQLTITRQSEGPYNKNNQQNFENNSTSGVIKSKDSVADGTKSSANNTFKTKNTKPLPPEKIIIPELQIDAPPFVQVGLIHRPLSPETMPNLGMSCPIIEISADTTSDNSLYQGFRQVRLNESTENYQDSISTQTQQNKTSPDSSVNTETINFTESKTIGKAFDTYIIFERENNLFFVDQHAAHEMLLYKKFTEDYQQQKNIKQQLLLPYVFNVNQAEREFISKNLQKISQCGFEIEEFGESAFKISEVPLIFANINFEKFTNSFLHDLSAIDIDIKYISDRLAKAACKAAIKAGDKISNDDISYLKKMLDDEDTLRCPHGRPVVIKVSKYEIEKWFKRVI